MKYNYSKQLTDAFNWLKDNGLEDLVSSCETSIRFGETTDLREANSWLFITLFFIACFKEASLKNNDHAVELTQEHFNMFFWSIPTNYRIAILPLLNEGAQRRGVEIGLDVFNHPEPKMVLMLLSE